jgi:acetolactate synthase-1/2/3 large subunit
MNGGELIAEVLHAQGVRQIFTLCGGHISPILVSCKRKGVRVVDVRDEVTAVFAADAVARMTGIPGVAAVTAGPGVTNTLTAMQNAAMAQSPLVIFGGATATVLKGRGSLQDIDQLSLVEPIAKWTTTISSVRQLVPTVEKAFEVALEGVPGPVFIEVPVDILYDEEIVRQWYREQSGVDKSDDVVTKAIDIYLRQHLFRQFAASEWRSPGGRKRPEPARPRTDTVKKVARMLERAERPVLVMGSQSMLMADEATRIADSVRALGVPTYLGGMSRGLLGQHSDVQFRHKRSAALKKADLVLVAGFPFDFRLGYGQSINRKAKVVAINRSSEELTKNRRPTVGIEADAGRFIQELARHARPDAGRWNAWFDQLRENELNREDDIARRGEAETEYCNPLAICQAIEAAMDDDAVIVVDGGDFVATAAYILRPRGPLAWLDPGVFGTLGVGGGFATGAALVRPDSEVWLMYGDGSSAYSLAEFDTWVRHGLAPIAVIGTDASWAQIAREQGEILGDLCGTELLRTEYHKVAEGYGGVGLLLTDPADIESTIAEAKRHAKAGRPVCINAHIGSVDFRKGSISI